MNKAKAPSQRQLRVGEQIRHIVSEVMQRGLFHKDGLLSANHITVSEVRTSPDLKNATAYVIGHGDKNMDSILKALNEESHIFQKEINRQSNLKFTPKIRFVVDHSFEQAQRIEDILKEVSLPPDQED